MWLAKRNIAASPCTGLQHDIDRLFSSLLGRESCIHADGNRPFPALNVWEDGERFYAEAEVPGLGLDDLELLVHGNELTIKGRRKSVDGQDAVYHRRERTPGEFSRFLTLPAEIDADAVQADLKDGVLTIVMPKAATAKARKIKVKVA